jgi:hypothetical protein
MALNNFIPALWSARLLANLNKAHVYGQDLVIGREYEGEIRGAGSSVKINSIGRVTIGDYVKNTDITAPETLTDAQRELLINQQKFFNFQVDDVDKAQQTPKVMDEAMRESAYGLRDVSDTYIAGLYTAFTNTLGDDTTPIAIDTAAKAYEYLVDLGVMLDEANVPQEGRWVILPPWYHGRLQKDDRFVKSGTPTGDQVLRNGQVGEAAGFTVLKSNNSPVVSGTKYKITAGHKMAWSYADQIVSVEGYRPEKRFADAMKGLHVYGAKVVRPTAAAVLTCTKS